LIEKEKTGKSQGGEKLARKLQVMSELCIESLQEVRAYTTMFEDYLLAKNGEATFFMKINKLTDKKCQFDLENYV